MLNWYVQKNLPASSHFPRRLDPRDQRRGAEPRQERHEPDLRPDRLQRPALTRIELLQRVVPRLRIHIRPQRPDLRVEPRRAKNKNPVHARQRRERIRPLLLALDRPRRPFERPHARVRVQRNKQRIAQRPRLLQIKQMPRVQEIEHPVRQHHALPFRAPRLASRHRAFERKEFWVVQFHDLASLTIPLPL